MKIEIVARNYEVNEHLRKVTEQKLDKLDKYFDEEASAKVSFKKQAQSLTTEVMLDYCGRLVRATASSDNFYDNLDIVLPKLEGQIRKYRTRFDKHNKNAAFREAAVYALNENNAKQNVVKEKKFRLSPMTVGEAAEEMELLGHSFYVFLEAKSNTVQVLYKRNDGDLGLIEPEFSDGNRYIYRLAVFSVFHRGSGRRTFRRRSSRGGSFFGIVQGIQRGVCKRGKSARGEYAHTLGAHLNHPVRAAVIQS